MITIDRSKLNAEIRNLPINPKLEDFVLKVALAKPLCEFSFGEHSKRTHYDYTTTPATRFEELYRVEVHQAGEKLGGLFMGERYVEGKKEEVYGVDSFRIQKERGRTDATQTKDIKVALRNAKKSFVSRADDELRDLIKTSVSDWMNGVENSARSSVTYTMDTQAEAFNVAMRAYEARVVGVQTFTAPSMPVTVRSHRTKEHEKECENYVAGKFLNEQLKAGHGYGVSIYVNGGLAVLNFADLSINKFKSTELLPLDIQSKLAMFKVIGVEEPYAHLGCKFQGEMYYIVAGDMNLEN
jgi:hypothetical protein